MTPERFTLKTREALNRAQSLARQQGHQRLELEHVLFAAFEDPEGMARALSAKVGVDAPRITQDLDAHLRTLPKVSGGNGQIYVGDGLSRAFNAAEKVAGTLHDEYLSIEHLLLGALEEKGRRPCA